MKMPSTVGESCPPQVFRLIQQVRFDAPRAQEQEDEAFDVRAGSLTIYLGPQTVFNGENHLYRFSDGRVGVLGNAPDSRFMPVTDPEIIALVGQVRTLSELAAEKGLRVETTSALDPFTLIVCPLCRGTAFTTIDLASVWCDRCNTRFTTRMTAGDPGVVVDAVPADYRPGYARYIIPRCGTVLTMVLKDFGYSHHPQGKCGGWCVNGTTHEERAAQGDYVPAPTSLRDPARWCGLEVYDWSLWGRPEDLQREERWLRAIDGDPEAADRIYGKVLHGCGLPMPELLADGTDKEREWWYLADVLPDHHGLTRWPVWWRVRATAVESWQVIDRSLCPSCLRPAGEGEHRHCRWDEMGWHPPE